jgi:predicted ribosome quality control (RQC) complex YloA/Tae2 family protein
LRAFATNRRVTVEKRPCAHNRNQELAPRGPEYSRHNPPVGIARDMTMALSVTEIEQVLAEIVPAVQGGWIQKVYQPAPLALLLEIRSHGSTHRLLVSCQPETARLHLASRPPANPPQPPPFCQFLRAHVQGARIDAVRQRTNDRVVEFHLTTQAGLRRLVCELTGKTANVLLLDSGGLVLRGLRHHRDLVGQLYTAPLGRTSPTRAPQASRFTDGGGSFPISAAIEAHYREKEAALAGDAAKESRRRFLQQALKKEQRRIDAWQQDLTKARKYRDYARYGELLKANLGTIKKGADRVTLIDYYDEALPEVTIPLDSTKSAQANMDDYFRKHRKYVRADQELQPRIDEGQRHVAEMRRELAAIEEGIWTPLPIVSSSAIARTLQETPRKPARGPFRRFTSADGLPIFVGRNARENDELTFGLAKSDDLWLHARGTPGSHVVVRLGKGVDPPSETLRDAATLALLYSDLKKSGKGDVIYTRRKWVKKAKGQATGAVAVTQEKSLYVTLDKARLAALKSRSQPDRRR